MYTLLFVDDEADIVASLHRQVVEQQRASRVRRAATEHHGFRQILRPLQAPLHIDVALDYRMAEPTPLLLATILWGVAFGAVPTLFQTALARRAGAAADLAQSMLVTGWNLAIAAGGVAGGVLLQAGGPNQLGWLPLLLLAVSVAWLLARPKAWV